MTLNNVAAVAAVVAFAVAGPALAQNAGPASTRLRPRLLSTTVIASEAAQPRRSPQPSGLPGVQPARLLGA